MIHVRRLLCAASLIALSGLAGSASAQAQRPKVILLGFDGVSADRCEKLMTDGHLPNLVALGRAGGYARLTPSNPAQSPVSWATIETGVNPGVHGIFDFLRRKPNRKRDGIEVSIGLGEEIDPPTPVLDWYVRAGLVGAAGAVGGAAGIGVVFALWAGERRKRRPKGLLQGTATGAAALFACAMHLVLAWVPTEMKFARNLRSGDAIWSRLDKAGVRAIALEAPLSFPADEMHEGCCQSGLGTPDLAMTWGTYSLWTDDAAGSTRTEMGGLTFFVEPGATSFDLVLHGPKNPLADKARVGAALDEAGVERNKRLAAWDWTEGRRRASETREELLGRAGSLCVKLAAQVDRGRSVRLTTPEQAQVTLVPGVWSDLVPVIFRVSPIVKVNGLVRFLLESAGGAPKADGTPWTPLSIFVSPVQMDPAHLTPNMQIASPMEFAPQLAEKNGAFETMGWPEMNNAVKDDTIADRAFLDHVSLVRTSRERRFLQQLARNDWDFLFGMFSEPDRVQHALYRHVDEKSPRHDAKVAAEFAGEIDQSYVEMDRFVGEVIRRAPPGTRIFVCSDHGFAPFRRGVNLNNFLMKIGKQVRTGPAGGKSMFDMQGLSLDWEHSPAYAIGLGNLYLNRVGREPLGCVKDEDAEKQLAEIEAALLALRDKDGAKVVHRVYRGKDLFHGPRAGDAPDLVIGFEWGYRVSWQNCLGSLDTDVITDNTFRWSGDHCSVDPELVQGVFFSSLPIETTSTPNVIDVAPTVLSLYGVTPPDADGRSLLVK